MTEAKHTKGPWFASMDDATDCPDHKHSGLAMIDTGRSADWPIARLMEWNNVPLVLAAPDLLEALEAGVVFLEKVIEESDRLGSRHVPAVLAPMKAAMAKAKGEQQ